MNNARRLLAILGQTATGKSALAIALAQRIGGEIINCDSTAVYRGFDIGTDKVSLHARQDVPHHLIDIVEPTAHYTAADYARDAARVVSEVHGRGHVPILVGGSGLYYRALTRGLFPGPGTNPALRDRFERIANRRGVEFLWRAVRRVDPASAARILPRDRKRLVRALEVYRETGRTLTAHFADTQSLLPDDTVTIAFGLRLDAETLHRRLADRVDAQLAAGLIDEVRHLRASGVPAGARPFGGLVYRQVVEHLAGVRDLSATRDLIVQENRRYARRQLIWFRKEPTLIWFEGPGESAALQARASAALAERGFSIDGGPAAHA